MAFKDPEREKARAAEARWRAKNPEKVKAKNARNRIARKARLEAKGEFQTYNLKNTLKSHGLLLEDFLRLVEEQNGLCLICSRPPKKGRLFVDHCHKTERVRGLLCHHCNAGIGHFFEDVAAMMRAIDYINKHKKV